MSPAFAIRGNASRKEFLVWWSSCNPQDDPLHITCTNKEFSKTILTPFYVLILEYEHIHQTCLTAPSHSNIVRSFFLPCFFSHLEHIRKTEKHDWELTLTAGDG